MTIGEELAMRHASRRLYACGSRAIEELHLEVIGACSERTPVIARLIKFCDLLDAVGGRRTLDALGANGPIRSPLHLVRTR